MIDLHEKAVEDFSVVIKRNPKNAHAYFRRAFSLKSLKVSFPFNQFFSGLQKQQMTLSQLRS